MKNTLGTSIVTFLAYKNIDNKKTKHIKKQEKILQREQMSQTASNNKHQLNQH